MNADSKLVNSVIEGYAGHQGGQNGIITRVVIHGTVSALLAEGAENTAHYFQSPNSGGLAHYIVDLNSIVQSCIESRWSWHAPPNPGSIGIELNDPQNHQAPRWKDNDHKAMLYLAACLTADICKRHGLPIVKLSPADLLAGKKGICGHVDVSQAWHQSDHTDPGDDFPWNYFIALVQAAYDHYTQDEEDFTLTPEIKAEFDAINRKIDGMGRSIIGAAKADGTDTDPTHNSITDILVDLAQARKDTDAKLDEIIQWISKHP